MRRFFPSVILFSLFLLVCFPTPGLAWPEAQEATPTEAVPLPAETTIPPEQPAPLQVTAIEPDHVNTEFGGPISIYGTGFQPGTAVRLVGYGLLDSGVINSTAIKAVLPPGLKKGNYPLELIQPDGNSLRVEGAIRVHPPKQPTATAAPRGNQVASVYGLPQLVIQSARTEPESLRPGSPFSLVFQVANRGDYTALNVRISLNAALAVPREGSSLVVVDKIAGGQVVDLELPLALVSTAPAGYQGLELVLEYSDGLARSYQSPQSVGLNVISSVASQPMVLLSAYTTEPEVLSPGDNFILALELVNAGRNEAEQVLVTLGGEGEAGQESAGIKPFAILGASNVKFLPSLAGGETTRVEHNLILDGAAESGVYNLPVSLAYDDGAGGRRTESHLINLLVNRRPQVQVDFYRAPDPGTVGQPLTLPIELVNIGRSLINVSTAEISGEGFEITTGSAYIGVLDGGTAGTLDAVIVPQSSGALPVKVGVSYLDDFNQPQTLTETLTVQVEPPPTPIPEDAQGSEGEAGGLGSSILKILRGLFGLGS